MTDRLKFAVGEAERGKRLDAFLASRLSYVSRMRIARLITEGGCLIDGETAASGRKLLGGEAVEVLPFEFVPSSMTPQALPLDVVFEDRHIIVVSKPAGMLVHPTLGVKAGTLANALTYHLNRDYFNGRPDLLLPEFGVESISRDNLALSLKMEAAPEGESLIRPGIVHRLDRATSGLLVVAKSAHALSLLSRHFRRGLVRKKYLALVRGDIEEDEGTIRAPIGRYEERRPHWWIMESGRQAVTTWRVLFRFDSAALIELEPMTGRTNQLRIHCAWNGHAIMGDDLYDDRHRGAEDSEQDSVGSLTRTAATSRPATKEPPGRLFLHAWRLAFHHPDTGEWRQFVSKPPAQLSEYLLGLRAGPSREVSERIESAARDELTPHQCLLEPNQEGKT